MILKRRFIYIQVNKGQISARRVGHPETSVTRLCVALSHPRTLMGEFQEIATCLKGVLHQLGSRPWFKARVLIHLVPKVEGGYTNVELRAFREAAELAGAGPVFLLKDHPAVSDAELGALFKW
jgi:hypothetical protein